MESYIELITNIINDYYGSEFKENDIIEYDSMSFVEVVFLLEECFGIEFDITRIEVDSFNTISKICVYLEKLLKESNS